MVITLKVKNGLCCITKIKKATFRDYEKLKGLIASIYFFRIHQVIPSSMSALILLLPILVLFIMQEELYLFLQDLKAMLLKEKALATILIFLIFIIVR